MINTAVKLYRAFPYRPHCGTTHTFLCRAIVPHLSSVVCGERPSNHPNWRGWQK